MKILYLNTGMHNKNQHAINNYKNIDFVSINSIEQINQFNLTEFDCIFSPSEPMDVSLYPNTKFLFGPHFSIFPDGKLLKITGKNHVLNLLSEWVGNIWKNHRLCEKINICYLPFGVDAKLFNEIKPYKDRHNIMVYSKHRSQGDLNIIINLLNSKGFEFKIFDYDQRYSELEYINYLHESKYAIIIDAHESQGFAIQEAMSCNVPLLVWSVKSMNQEAGQNYPDYFATSIPYWDEKCGEVFYELKDMESTFELFLSKLELELYNPREYILENLSIEVCEKKMMNLIKDI
jgi:hypothetical protein